MLVVDDYLDLAKSEQNLSSDRELSKFLGLSQNAVNYYRTKRSWPSDNTMVTLVDICFPDATESELEERRLIALLQLNEWRTEGKSQGVYRAMATRLAGTLAAIPLVITLGLPSGVGETKAEQSNLINKHSVYYGFEIRR